MPERHGPGVARARRVSTSAVGAVLAALLLAVAGKAGAQAATDPAPSRWPAGAEQAPVPDDSPSAQEAARARLRAAPRRPVCADSTRGSRPFGTSCATREFDAPPRLTAPRLRWQIEPGWRGLWSPFLIDDLVLTGSCFNETHKGLSAIDQTTGRVRWRIAAPCAEGNRAGSVGQSALAEWREGQLLWTLGRDDGKAPDHVVVDLRSGRIVESRKPAKPGPLRLRDGLFLTITRSEADQATYLNALSAQLDSVAWRLEGFRYRCDKLDPLCEPVFSAPAGAAGIEYFSATARDQGEPPTRLLHAVDVRSGRLLWRHEAQPVTNAGPGGQQRRSDDGPPMVADDRVIIRLDGSTGPAPASATPASLAFRALHARTGQILWTTAPLPARFVEPWAGSRNQQRGTWLVSGDRLVAEVVNGDGSARELWAYRLADGTLAWRRPVSRDLRLMTAAGGVVHAAERSPDGRAPHVLLGLDGQTGTLLWSAPVPAHNNPMPLGWPVDGPESNVMLGPFYRIARDGAIVGTTVTTVYRMD